MKTYTIIFGVLIYLAASNARNFERRDIASDVEDNVNTVRRVREHAPNQRHKRRSWHTNYGYDYPQPPMPFYQDRRDYEQQSQQDIIPQIWRLLDEISSFVRRPPIPPQPQPVYIPYAVPYPVAQTCKCDIQTGPKNDKNITFNTRFKDMEEEQNWGIVDSNEGVTFDEGDGSRPISFIPVLPQRPLKRPAIQVEHGSKQSGIAAGSVAPTTQSPISGQDRTPSMCDIFSLSCCTGTRQQQRQCFTNVGCIMTYNNGKACDHERVLAIIDAYSKAYSPGQ